MDLKTAAQKQESVINSTLKNKINNAFKDLSEVVYASRNGNYITEFEELEQTYKNILKYSFGYATDPEREKIFNGLKRRIIELTDDVFIAIGESENDWYSMQRKYDQSFLGLGEKEKSALVDEMSVEKEFSELLDDIEPAKDSSSETEKKYSASLEQVFNILWLTNNYSEGERLLSNKLIKAKHIPRHDKSLIVSAVTLSLIRHFDLHKAELLFDIYREGENEVCHRALVGLMFALIVYDARLNLYPELINRLKSYEKPEELGWQLEQIILQFSRAKETEKVTEKIQNEIIPEVMKLRPDIEEKLKLDELLSKDSLEEKNPDWEEFFSDSPDVYKKLEEFSMMQMDGSDVFMGAFSMLKRFGFFESLSNWFLPFYKEHPEIQKSIKGVEDTFDWNAFFDGIQQAPVMCNSDKYSFCFNIGFMPDMQKTMMLEMFNQELSQMKELAEEDNKHDVKGQNKVYFTQYIQDLYRFFKLYPEKNNFTDIFKLELDIVNSDFLKLVFENKNIRKVAEYYFQKNYYDEARELFEKLLANGKEFELIEKIGFCFQKTGDFEKAIDYYKQAEILDTNRTWLHKKLGYCFRSVGKFDEAIEYYTKVEHTEKDNLQVQALLGQLHIDKEDYETALKYYFKVEYLKPDLVKVQRPIAWCSFLLGKAEQAIRYLEKVTSIEGQRSDYLNLGHCKWVSGEIEGAIENYRKAIKRSGSDTEWFPNAILLDAGYLEKFGIKPLDISLMADYLMLDFD